MIMEMSKRCTDIPWIMLILFAHHNKDADWAMGMRKACLFALVVVPL
jgi:hypothetical protein